MNRLLGLSAAALATVALSAPLRAEVPLGSHGTAGSDAQGIGIAVEQGIVLINVHNIDGSGDWKEVWLEHDSPGFQVQMEGGVRCKYNHGITRAGLFVGDEEAEVWVPGGMPRERYFTDSFFVDADSYGEGEGTIGFDPIASVEQELQKYVDGGGHPVDWLRQDHTFNVWVQPNFRAVCRQKVGGGAATGGYWYEQAIAEGGLKVTVHYKGDKYLASGRARQNTATNGNHGGPPARTSRGDAAGDKALPKLSEGAAKPRRSGRHINVATGDVNGDGKPDPATESDRGGDNGGGAMKAARSFVGGLLRGKKVKDAALDAALGEED